MHVFVASKLKGKSVIRHVRLSIKTYFLKITLCLQLCRCCQNREWKLCTQCPEKQGLGADLHLPWRLNPCL